VLHRRRQHVDEHLAAGGRDDPRAELGTPDELERHRVHREDVAGDPGDAALVDVDRADEMPVRLALEVPAMDDVDLFARAEDIADHRCGACRRTGPSESPGFGKERAVWVVQSLFEKAGRPSRTGFQPVCLRASSPWHRLSGVGLEAPEQTGQRHCPTFQAGS